MKYLGAKSEYPYNINKNDFINNHLKVIYNSVGCGGIYEEGMKRLQNADYISVRDLRSFNFLKKDINNLFLVPDSAIILSDVYPKNSNISDKTSQFINKKYIFFQLSNHKFGGKQEFLQIIQQIQNILERYKELEFVLCPIGTAPGHNDDIILKKIKKSIPNERLHYIDSPSIQDIATLISNSSCYIGTSLHGIITAMSYNIPYIGLNPKQQKLVSYNDTWSINELKTICPIQNFENQFNIINKLNKNNLLSDKIRFNTSKQKELYYQSFERIYNILMS